MKARSWGQLMSPEGRATHCEQDNKKAKDEEERDGGVDSGGVSWLGW